MARRLSPLDIAFLKMETAEAPSHVASLQIFEMPPGYQGNFVADLKARLAAIPVGEPFNLMLSPKGLPLSFPTWIRDKNFDIDFHLRHSALPQPGGMDELMRLVARLHGRLLDRSRPLWEMYLIEGLQGNRFALFTKIHHALVDGVGGMKMVERTFAHSPDVTEVTAPWAIGVPAKPARAPRTLVQTGQLLGKALAMQLRALPQVVKAVALPGDTEAGIAFASPKTVFNGHISASRRFAVQSLSLTHTKAVGKALGHTVNDLFLAISASALRRYLDERKALPAKPLIATVPVSIQLAGHEKQGNQISYVAVNLRTDVHDAMARLVAIGRSAAAAKADMARLSRDAVQTLAVIAQGSAALINQFRLADVLNPPANLVLSNVPGPRETLYFMGAKLVGYYPLSILMDGQALNITVCSHGDRLDFGILGCRNAMPDVDVLARYVGEAFAELQTLAQIQEEPKRKASRVRRKDTGTERKKAPAGARTAVKSPGRRRSAGSPTTAT